jgi:hypothetical protein
MAHAGRDGAFHRLTVAPMITALENLGGILAKAEAYAAERKIDPQTLLEARLYPDMYSLIQQLQYCLFLPADFAQHFVAEPPPKIGYEEKSFADIRAGIGLAKAYLRAVSPARMDERAGETVPLFFDAAQGLTAEATAANLVMPDFYFHLTVAYAILRHNGVAVGKHDFLGKLDTVAIKS